MASATATKAAPASAPVATPPGQPTLFARYVVTGGDELKSKFHVVKEYWTTTGTGGEEKLPVVKRIPTRFATAAEAKDAAAAMQSGTYVAKASVKGSLAGLTPEERKARAQANRAAKRLEVKAKLAQLEKMLAEQAAQG